MSKIQKQHLVFITSAELEENGRMEDEDSALINTIAEKLYNGNINAKKVLFVTEGSLASLETALHVEDQLCSWGKRREKDMRHLRIRLNFWERYEVGGIFKDVFQKSMLDEDLWLFIGTPQYIFRIIAVFLPEQHEIYGMSPDEIPSVACIGSTIDRSSFLNVKMEICNTKYVH